MVQCNKKTLKSVFSICISLLFILIVDYIIQVKFYNFALNFVYKLLLYFGCVLIADYLFSIKERKFYIVKLLCCVFAVFLLDNPTCKTIDVFNQKYRDFRNIENIENGWLYTSMINFNKSVLFPIIESNIIYAVEISKSRPIFLKYDYNELNQYKYEDGILIKYCIDENNVLFSYSMLDYNYYGYMDTDKYNLEEF